MTKMTLADEIDLRIKAFKDKSGKLPTRISLGKRKVDALKAAQLRYNQKLVISEDGISYNGIPVELFPGNVYQVQVS